jgi:hypothetical protein
MIANGISPDTVTYKVLENGYCKEKELDETLQCNEMPNTGVPVEEITYTTLVEKLHPHTDAAISNQE